MADTKAPTMFDDLVSFMVDQFQIKPEAASTFLDGKLAKGVPGRLRKAASRPNDPFFKGKKREASTLFQAEE